MGTAKPLASVRLTTEKNSLKGKLFRTLCASRRRQSAGQLNDLLDCGDFPHFSTEEQSYGAKVEVD